MRDSEHPSYPDTPFYKDISPKNVRESGHYRLSIFIDSWKNVVFAPLLPWKSVRNWIDLYWKSVFFLVFVLVFK